MATTAQGTISPWLNNTQQFNRFFLARPLSSENNFQLDNDYDGRLLEEIPTEMAINGPEARAPGRVHGPIVFCLSGVINSHTEYLTYVYTRCTKETEWHKRQRKEYPKQSGRSASDGSSSPALQQA